MSKNTSFERPPVRINNSGVSSVLPGDILRSKVGQAEIQKAIKANIHSPKRVNRGIHEVPVS